MLSRNLVCQHSWHQTAQWHCCTLILSSPVVCSWCVFGQAAEGLFWLSPAEGKQGPEVSDAYSPRWSLSSPAGGSKQIHRFQLSLRGSQRWSRLFTGIIKLYVSILLSKFALKQSVVQHFCFFLLLTSNLNFYKIIYTYIRYQHTCLTRPWKTNHNKKLHFKYRTEGQKKR